jgi:hypothetical protein
VDSRRFDSLARSVAGPRTRRGLLGSLAALAAGLTAHRAVDAQVTQAQCGNVVCYNRATQAVDVACRPGCVCCVFGNGNSRCMPPGNCTGTITCSPANGPCSEHAHCCDDGFCFAGRCVVVPPSTEPAPI